jgi:hypothetical protein
MSKNMLTMIVGFMLVPPLGCGFDEAEGTKPQETVGDPGERLVGEATGSSGKTTWTSTPTWMCSRPTGW